MLVGVAVLLAVTVAVEVLLGVGVLLGDVVTLGLNLLPGPGVRLGLAVVLPGLVVVGFISGLRFGWLHPFSANSRNNPRKNAVNAFKACNRLVSISIL